MPQMAPIYWLYLLFFFLLTLLLFSMLNYYLKPFDKMITTSLNNKSNFKYWKL